MTKQHKDITMRIDAERVASSQVTCTELNKYRTAHQIAKCIAISGRPLITTSGPLITTSGYERATAELEDERQTLMIDRRTKVPP